MIEFTLKSGNNCELPGSSGPRLPAYGQYSQEGFFMKKIGILTSGGDCSGMNAAIRSGVRTALNCGVEVIGFKKGFQGLITHDRLIMDSKSVDGILQKRGTLLHTARCAEVKADDGRKTAMENLIGLGV